MTKIYRKKKPDLSYLEPEYWYDTFKVIKKHLLIKFRKPFLPKRAILTKYHGCHFIADPSTGLGRELLLYDGYEYKQIRWLLNQAKKLSSREDKKIDFFLDIGANMGIYGLIFYRKLSPYFVHMFEPNIDAIALIKSHLLLNGIKDSQRIFVHNAAISNKTDLSLFFKNNQTTINNERNHLIEANNQSYNNSLKESLITENNQITLDKIAKLKLERILFNGGSIKTNPKTMKAINKIDAVNTINLSDMFRQRNKIFIIKMDIEGNEYLSLRTMQNIFKYNKVILQIEIFPKNLKKVVPLLQTMNVKIHKKYGPLGFPDYMCSNCLNLPDLSHSLLQK